MDYQKKYRKYKKKYLRLIGKLTGGMVAGPAVNIARLEDGLRDTTPEGGVWDYDPNKTLINGVDKILQLKNDDIKYLIFKDGMWQILLMPLDYSGTNKEAVEADAKHDYVTHLNQIKRIFGERTDEFKKFMEEFDESPKYLQEFQEFIDKKKSDQDVEKLKKEFIDKKKIEYSQYSPAFNKLKEEYIGTSIDEKGTLNRQLAKKPGKYMVGINTPSLSSVMGDVEHFLGRGTGLAFDHGHVKDSVKDGIKGSSFRIWNAVLTTDKPLSSYNNEMEHVDTLLGLFDRNREEVEYDKLSEEQRLLVESGTSIKISKYPLEDGGFLISVIQTRKTPDNKVKNFRYLIKIDNGLITSCGEFEGGGDISKILENVEYDEEKKKFVLNLTNGQKIDPNAMEEEGQKIYVDFSVIMKLKTEGDAATLAGCIIENAAGASHDNLVFVRAINSQTFSLEGKPILQGGLSMMMIIKTGPEKQGKQNQQKKDAALADEVVGPGVEYGNEISEKEFDDYARLEEYSLHLSENIEALQYEIDRLGDEDEIGLLEDEKSSLIEESKIIEKKLEDFLNDGFNESYFEEEDDETYKTNYQEIYEKRKRAEEASENTYNLTLFKGDYEFSEGELKKTQISKKKAKYKSLEQLSTELRKQLLGNNEDLKAGPLGGKRRKDRQPMLSLVLPSKVREVTPPHQRDTRSNRLKREELKREELYKRQSGVDKARNKRLNDALERTAANHKGKLRDGRVSHEAAAQMIYSLIITFTYRNPDVGLFIKNYNQEIILGQIVDSIKKYKLAKTMQPNIKEMLEIIVTDLITLIEQTLKEEKNALKEEIKALEKELKALKQEAEAAEAAGNAAAGAEDMQYGPGAAAADYDGIVAAGAGVDAGAAEAETR